jgi:hypothetical protein
MARPSRKTCTDQAFHVDYNGAMDRWNVVDHDGRVLGHCQNQGEAIDLAIREAQHSHSRGDDIVVCVEGADGHYTLAWSPN